MNKLVIKVVALLLILIPTYAAIYFYLSAKDSPVDENSVYAVDFTDTRGATVHYERSTDIGKKLIEMLMAIHSGAKSAEALPTELIDSPCISVNFFSYDIQTDYKYYFSPTKPSTSYYLDNEDNAFRISASDAIAFLDSEYSACLYESSKTPSLSVMGKTVTPSSLDWSYYTYSNVEHKVPLPEASANNTALSSSYKKFSLAFDRYPDSSKLTIKDQNGKLLFDGNLAEFNESDVIRKSVRENTILTFDIDAGWEELHGSSVVGSASYHFNVNVIFDPSATVWLSEDSVENGDIVVISGEFIEDPQALQLTCPPEMGVEPIIFADGENVRCILPIKKDLVSAQTTFTIAVDYNSIHNELNLTVKPSSHNSVEKKFNYSGKIDNSLRSTGNLAAMRDLIAGLPYENEIYFNGAFNVPTDHIRASFGDIVDNGDADDKFMSDGMAFVRYKDETITAANAGKVIYVGDTALGGTTIVIDHGLGLRSVYYCVSSPLVAVGETVTAATEIAHGGGKIGYTDGLTCYLEFWVGSTPVAYYSFVEGGRNGQIVFGRPNE